MMATEDGETTKVKAAGIVIGYWMAKGFLGLAAV